MIKPARISLRLARREDIPAIQVRTMDDEFVSSHQPFRSIAAPSPSLRDDPFE
jgi:hypothetical protein